MKILIVSNGYPPASFGGVEVYSYDLVHELQRRGHELQVLCRDSDQAVPDYTVRPSDIDGVPVTRIVNDHKQAAAFQDLYQDQKIDQIFSDRLDAFQPDLVHFNHLLALSAALPRETALRIIPSIIMLHDYWPICQRVNLVDRWQHICPGPRQGGDCQTCVFGAPTASGGLVQFAKKVLPFRLRGQLRKILRPAENTIHFNSVSGAFERREMVFRDALHHADRMLVPSKFLRTMITSNGMADDPIELLPLGIGIEPHTGRARSSGPLHFAYAGSVTQIKGVETLLRAFRTVDLDSIRLDIYGREDLSSQFSRELHRLAQGDSRIVFHGPYAPDQRAAIYEQADVLVMPSLWHETFSLVAREALLCGVPVIASRVGALQELVQQGKNGFLFPPGDVEALAKVIGQIGEQPGCLSALETPGPVEILSIAEHVDRIEAVYGELVHRKEKAKG